MAANSEHHLQSSATRPATRLVVLKCLKTWADIAEDEAEFLVQNTGEASVAATGTELLRAGAALDQPRVILSGWAGLAGPAEKNSRL